MSIELKVPEVGESVSEVQVGDWARQEGDHVDRDQVLVAIESDKVTIEVTAPASGRLVKILLGKGAPARVGSVVGLFEPDEQVEVRPSAVPPSRSLFESTETPGAPAASLSERPAPASEASSAAETVPWASPAARRALAERGLRAEDVAAPSTRLLKEDVARHAAERPLLKAPEPDVSDPNAGAEEIVKMSPMRLRVAERLVESQRTMALLTTFNEVDLSAVQQLRSELKSDFLEKYGVKLGLMSFFVRACLEALKAYPVVNAEARGTDIVYKNHYDIGIAVGGGRGLVVPVLRNVERLGFAAIEKAIADFATRAKANKLELRELTGGTFTISNGGVYGSMLSTPIVNPPQSAILGLHAITDRPMARSGQVVILPMMYIALTYDHRIIDGREAVSFLRMVKELIENPIRMLLEI
ncbi:MAG TPA: 2-oxoglutarate dehydrogenase complex dihydrolipoyllysine-residue succinyltransferase [Polyangiaceae bacterium]